MFIESSIGLQVRGTINKARNTLDLVSRKLATGYEYPDWSENLFSSIQGSNQQAELKYVQNSLSTVMNLSTTLSIHSGSLKNMLSNLMEISTITHNLSGNWSQEMRDANQPVINELLKQVKNIADTTNYSGLNLLDGTLGGGEGAGNIKSASTVSNTVPLMSDLDDAAINGNVLRGSNLGKSFTIGTVADGETVTIDDLVFKFKNIPVEQTDVRIGDTAEETAENFLAVANGLTGNIANDSHKFNFKRLDDVAYAINNTPGGSAPTVTSSNTALNASVANAGGLRQKVLTFGAAYADTETIEINGVTFTSEDAGEDAAAKEFLATSAAAAAGSLMRNIQYTLAQGGADAAKLAKYDYNYDDDNDAIIISLKEDYASEQVFTDIKISDDTDLIMSDRYGSAGKRLNSFTITFAHGSTAVPQTITLDGVVFTTGAIEDTNTLTYIGNDTDVVNGGAFNAAGFRDLFNAIMADENHPAYKVLSRYECLRLGEVLTFNVKHDYNTSVVASGAPITVGNKIYANIDLFDFSDISDVDLSGKIEFQNVHRSVVDDGGKATVDAIRGEYGLAASSADLDPRAVEFMVKISDQFYTGLVSYDGDATTLIKSNPVITFKKLGVTGADLKTFSIPISWKIENYSLASATTRDAFIEEISASLEKITLNQNRYIKTDTSRGDIIANEEVVGSLKGFSASLSSGSFDGRSVKNVKIDYSLADGELKYEIQIDDKLFSLVESVTSSNAVRPNRKINAGEILTLKTEDGMESINIAVGHRDVDLSNDNAMSAIASAWRGALGAGFTDASYQVGPNASDRFEINLKDMRWSAIGKNMDLSVADVDVTVESYEVVKEAIAQIQQEIARNAAYDKALVSVQSKLQVSSENLTSSIESLLKVDPTKAREDMDTALSQIQAAMTVLMNKRSIDQVLARIIESQ